MKSRQLPRHTLKQLTTPRALTLHYHKWLDVEAVHAFWIDSRGDCRPLVGKKLQTTHIKECLES